MSLFDDPLTSVTGPVPADTTLTVDAWKEALRSIPKLEPVVRRFFVHPDDLHEMLRELRRIPGPHTGLEAVMVFESPNALLGVAAAEMTDGTLRFIELRAGTLATEPTP